MISKFSEGFIIYKADKCLMYKNLLLGYCHGYYDGYGFANFNKDWYV